MGKYETKDSNSVVRSFGAASVEMFRPKVNIYMLFTGWEVRTGKIFCRGLKNGPRPKAEGHF